MATHPRAAHKPLPYHSRTSESTASAQYRNNHQEKPTRDAYREKDMLQPGILNVARQNRRHTSPYIQFDYLIHAHS